MSDEYSRYRDSIIYQDAAGAQSLGLRERLDAPRRRDDRFHTLVSSDRLDLLANTYLGDPHLWWVIADYNDLLDPLDLTPGVVLRIPAIEYVYQVVLG